MADIFERMRFHAVIEDGQPRPERRLRSAAPDQDPDETSSTFNSDEAAARFHLDRLMAADARPALRGLRDAEAARRTPDLALTAEAATPMNTRIVSFTQTHATIPVFGTRAVVELTADRELLAAGASLADVGSVNPNASLSPVEALGRVADATGTTVATDAVAPRHLTLFRNPTGADADTRWHLAWIVPDYPAAPTEVDSTLGHGSAPSMRTLHPHYDYLVDAHTGDVLYSYSTTPTIMPAKLFGLDELDAQQELWGTQVEGDFALDDPLFDLVTYDLGLGDIDEVSFPTEPVRSTVADLAAAHRAAVTAHVNAGRVKDFYNSVLGRDSIDGKGMDLVSVVNCTLQRPGAPPSEEWENAVWWQDRMWYGQVQKDGRLVSLARHLDIIAHELTHGVTETTSGLVYADQSGALNESFSDIFGVLVKNWFLAPVRDDVTTWDFEIGTGWNGGIPLRDLSDPTRTGAPAHMDDYFPDPSRRDHGGVHTNSNIHNKAAHTVLTATDDDGTPTYSVRDAAVLFYVTLIRLAPLATFRDCRDAMVDSARSMYVGNDEVRDDKVAAIEAAYDAVGIV